MNTVNVAVVQMAAVHDKKKNLVHAAELISKVCAEPVDIAVLPEMFCCPYDNRYFREYGEPADGEAQESLSACARENHIYLIGGSIPELEGDRIYNTSYVYDREGRQIAKHRKVHLFDVDIEGGQRFFESEVLSPGEEITVFDTEFGPMGLCICFDFRSQELVKEMGNRGARVIFVPGAFNMTTGPAHWELLFRGRAVDNQLFTVGTAPARNEEESYISYGNSIAVDPWGKVLLRFGAGEEYGVVTMDLDYIEAIRRQLPIIASRKPEVYG